MFKPTILFRCSESIVLNKCLKTFLARAMSLSAEVQCIMTSSGKSNPINHNKTILDVLL